MALTDAQVKTAVLIGKYGGCLPACEGGAMILGAFNLAGCIIVIQPAEKAFHGGAFRPEIYYPWRDEEDEVVWKPREDEEYEVIINIKLGKRDVKRYYFVRKRTSVVIIQVIHFLNTTKSRVTIGVGAFTKTIKKAAVALRNLVKKP